MKTFRYAVLAAVALIGPAGNVEADAIWTGNGDGVNWSDSANWDGDPTAGGTIGLTAGSSLVDVDASGWGISGVFMEQGNGDANLELSDIAAYDLGNGLSVPLFTFSFTGITNPFAPDRITIGPLPAGAESASVTQTGSGVTLDFVGVSLPVGGLLLIIR